MPGGWQSHRLCRSRTPPGGHACPGRQPGTVTPSTPIRCPRGHRALWHSGSSGPGCIPPPPTLTNNGPGDRMLPSAASPASTTRQNYPANQPVSADSNPLCSLTVVILWGESIHGGDAMEAILSLVALGELSLGWVGREV